MMDNTHSRTRGFWSSIRILATRYQDFLLEPGTLFTVASGVLLIIAIVMYPQNMLSEGNNSGEGNWLYLLSALVGSSFIWWSAYQGIKERDFTADIPVTIATIAAIAIGQYSAAAVVAVLLLLGGMLEEFVSARAGKALESLAKLLPDRVTVRRDGHDIVVPLEEVKVGDTILVKSGERIAVDGTVLSGTASVNQAVITGESLPVDKQEGDNVFAGTLNEVGAMEILATKVGNETTLGQIHRLIEEAQTQKPNVERLLNNHAKFYTPTAIILGVLLWWWSGDLTRAITMLIVFCPCVMVLATPTALVASVGNAALRGNLIKKGATIESMAKIDTVIFDKTGTLTHGEPKLADIIALNNNKDEDLLLLAAIAEKFSEHPLGKAVVKAAEEKGFLIPDPESFESISGAGIKIKTRGKNIFIGRLKQASELNLSISHEAEESIKEQSQLGRNVVMMGIDNEIAGLLTFEDKIRPESKKSIESLHRLGIKTIMVTGDSKVVAEQTAKALGINDIYAEVMPQEKVKIVKRLQSEGHKIIFVGDGVNDGPALVTADVGIAMGLTGTDVAIETAEVGLLSDDLLKIPYLISVSKKAISTIWQNVVFSLSVLSMAVILTIPGILTPVTGALLHELSSIPVIMNSARLITYSPKD
ncbi:cation-translocating P-type ATPase [Methanosarcina sp.]|uniref:heavy metal translocating P-type ATPase n=1 Tax=Methanosarcina sp. TaxID=2213 RepID=UPI002988DC01|nr:cation-translocating P-type ATPase [Methanosarcina sp.]MDW5550146.1 cation-translocating P-type ATPase [Methanosarcina sp.]MDW5555323.1 cation-translocating P-type ATPase [Methanosarcina sp.]MDW5560524.1 cation-translocating P-type ATPase [Methanosarcina sp.]